MFVFFLKFSLFFSKWANILPILREKRDFLLGKIQNLSFTSVEFVSVDVEK